MPNDRRNRVSGSLDLLDEAAGRVKAHLNRRGTAELGDLLDTLVAEHPSMALRINLVDQVRGAGGHEAAATALESFLLGLVRERLQAAAAFAALVHEGGWGSVATYSRSGQVRECLASSRHAGLASVTLSEGRPAGEGLLMAKELRGEGLDVTLTADGALASLLPVVKAVVVGADACFADRFVNKVGTAALLRAARALGLPTVVVSLPQKHLAGEPALRWSNLPLDQPKGLGKLPKGVRWEGRLFEEVPWELVTHAIGRKGET